MQKEAERQEAEAEAATAKPSERDGAAATDGTHANTTTAANAEPSTGAQAGADPDANGGALCSPGLWDKKWQTRAHLDCRRLQKGTGTAAHKLPVGTARNRTHVKPD